MFLIRADGNPQIGTGHIMRCLSLADAFREQGKEIAFVIAKPYFQKLIQERGYLCTVLGTTFDHMEDELPLFLPILKRDRPELVILDSYFVTPKYMKMVKDAVPLLYIDDLNAFGYPADIVANYNIYGPEIPYSGSKTYFLGPKYAPLRKEFQGLGRRRVKKCVENVLVSTGGTDPYHVALRCAEYLREHLVSEGVTFHFVLGAMNRDVEALDRLSCGCPSIKLHRQVTDMCSLMMQCDAAISAGGTTLFELCACGLPTVTYILADNQIMNAGAFERSGLTLNAGDIRGDVCFAKRLFEILDALTENFALRQRMAEQMQDTVDGMGARRLAEALVKTGFGV